MDDPDTDSDLAGKITITMTVRTARFICGMIPNAALLRDEAMAGALEFMEAVETAIDDRGSP